MTDKKAWRPEGWENPKSQEQLLHPPGSLERISEIAYEAGADAMLEKLRAMGTPTEKFWPGKRVFIPDD
jgi:hypothetical protein